MTKSGIAQSDIEFGKSGVDMDETVLIADLFHQHHKAIFAYLYRLLGDSEWANDLTQETFEKVIAAGSKLDRVENPRAWIYRIASNLAFTALKRRNRFVWMPWGQVDDVHPRTGDIAGQVAEQIDVERTLAGLEPQYSAPLLLYSHVGLSVREVAEALQISEGAVKTRLYRAREQFRQAYDNNKEHVS